MFHLLLGNKPVLEPGNWLVAIFKKFNDKKRAV